MSIFSSLPRSNNSINFIPFRRRFWTGRYNETRWVFFFFLPSLKNDDVPLTPWKIAALGGKFYSSCRTLLLSLPFRKWRKIGSRYWREYSDRDSKKMKANMKLRDTGVVSFPFSFWIMYALLKYPPYVVDSVGCFFFPFLCGPALVWRSFEWTRDDYFFFLFIIIIPLFFPPTPTFC